MTFQPRMTNRISGFEVVGGWTRRVFGGIVADLWDVRCAPAAGGFYLSETPRLFAVLDTEGHQDRSIVMRDTSFGIVRAAPGQSLSFIPAGQELFAELHGVRSIRHLDVHFDVDILSRRLGEAIDPVTVEHALLMVSEPRLASLVDLLAAECAAPQPLNDLYGDSLALALFVALMRIAPPERPRQRGDLAPWQLRRVMERMDAQCPRGVRLEELAALAGLSQSHFCHAFKASTGLPPHQWQMRLRIERAKTLLARRQGTLSEVAAETGFADQAHFTRAFRKAAGVTPGQWMRSRT